MKNKFTKDYYENGIKTGISCFENYRWLPELTIPTVVGYIDYLNIKRRDYILDFGCAKGYYVKSFRLLGRNAWGCDVSEYAVSKADQHTKPFLKLSTDINPIPFSYEFDYIIAKDVLEHMSEINILNFLKSAHRKKVKCIFIIVPLGKNGKYINPEDEKDITHIIRYSQEEWNILLSFSGWTVTNFSHEVSNIKEKHTKLNLKSVGFFTLRS